MESIYVRNWEPRKRIEYYKALCLKKSKYKKDDRVLIHCLNKKVRTATITRANAMLKKGAVVEFERYFFCIDDYGYFISFVPEKNIKRKLR